MNILCVRIGRMGDMLMVLPALQVLQARYPNAVIDLLTSKDGRRVIPCADLNIGDIHVYDHCFAFRFIENKKVKKFIRNKDYDAIYVFEIKSRYRDWFASHPCQNIHLTQNNKMHASEAYLDSLGLTNQEIDYWRIKKIIEPPQSYALQIKEELQKYHINDRTYLVAIHPSYSGLGKNKKDQSHKLWPVAYWAKLVKLLQDEASFLGKDIRVVCDLLPSEKNIAEAIRQACGDDILILQNPPNFKRYIALIDRVNCLVAPNTGSMHLAAALNTPVIGLFSGLGPESCGPFASEDLAAILQAENYPQGEGLARIQPDMIIKNIMKWIGQKAD